jgi:hypothetical protein
MNMISCKNQDAYSCHMSREVFLNVSLSMLDTLFWFTLLPSTSSPEHVLCTQRRTCLECTLCFYYLECQGASYQGFEMQ